MANSAPNCYAPAMASNPARCASSSATELLLLSATALATGIRRRELSCEEVVRFFLGRAERLDSDLQAFVQLTGAQAVLDARLKDRALALRSLLRNERLPPFYGVPVGIKDLNFARGTFTRFGSRSFRHLWTPFDDRTTASLRRAGFVVMGKLATSEFGTMPVTEPDIHPPTRNPWNLEFSAGGSSGGSGAAVAAGLVPIAQGSDGAGSIRIPSAFCHLFGLKPSRWRVPDPYGRDDRTSLVSTGPMAHSVEDAAGMLDALAGTWNGREHWAPKPAHTFAAGVRNVSERGAARPLRVRFSAASPIARVDPEVRAALEETLRVVASLGHHVEEGKVPDGSLAEFLPVWQHMVASVSVPAEGGVQSITRWLRVAGRAIPKGFALQRRGELRARIHAWFGDADIWITPTVPAPPPRIGTWRDGDPATAFEQAADIGAFTAAFNLGGHPAASVPAGLTRAGMPIGVQLAGRLFEEETVLGLARQIELAAPWAGRRSPFFAR